MEDKQVSREEFEILEKRVSGLEHTVQSQKVEKELSSRKFQEQIRESYESYKRLIAQNSPYRF